MRFKDYEDYKNQRDALLKEAEDFLNAGKTEEYQSKADEVRELDAAFDTWKQEQANLEALKGAPKAPVTDPTNRVDLGGEKQNDELEYRKQFMAYTTFGRKNIFNVIWFRSIILTGNYESTFFI